MFRALAVTTALCCISLPAQPAGSADSLQIETLECRGNEATSCLFILSHLYLAVGDELNEEEIQNGRLRLASVLNFSAVDIYLEKGSARGLARVIVEVQEASPFLKEAVVGTSWRTGSLSQVLAGRLSHQNLFGAGKNLDLEVAGRASLDGPSREGFIGRLQYVDPHVFDSKSYFLIAGLRYFDTYGESREGDRYDHQQVALDLTVGRRIFDFSYVALEYQRRPKVHFQYRERTSEGGWIEEDNRFAYGVWVLAYGWNSEDDPWFPTSGSRLDYNLSLIFGSDAFHSIAFRKTWQMDGGSLWSTRIGANPGTKYRALRDESFGFSFSYARPISSLDEYGIERGRWYLEPGANDAQYYPAFADTVEIGLKAGVRFELKSFGIVDLYLIVSGEVRTGNR